MRRIAFVAVSIAMALAALLLGHRDEGAVSPTPASTTAPRRASPPNAPSPTPRLRTDARRFARAFLAYESGRAGRASRATIRRHAVAPFAEELLADPPKAGPRRPGPPPTPIALRATRLPHRPDLALVTGTAHRTSGPEPFAFLLARRGGRWLAIAPAE